MTSTDNNLDTQEHEGKSKNTTTLVSRIPENEFWVVEEIDKIASKQNRSRSYVALKLLGKMLPKFKGEVL